MLIAHTFDYHNQILETNGKKKKKFYIACAYNPAKDHWVRMKDLDIDT